MKRQEEELVGPCYLSRFIFIKIDLRWIYSGYWLVLAARSTYNTEERVEIERESFFFPMLLLFRECHLVPAATGTSDILIFSRKNKKEREKKVYEWIKDGETRGFHVISHGSSRFPSRTLDIAVIRSALPSDCLAQVYGIQGPGEIQYGW